MQILLKSNIRRKLSNWFHFNCHGRGVLFDEFLGTASNNFHRCCSNCEMNDGMIYMSNPPKYRCTLTGNFNEANHICNSDE